MGGVGFDGVARSRWGGPQATVDSRVYDAVVVGSPAGMQDASTMEKLPWNVVGC
jgi:hypothetical protein